MEPLRKNSRRSNPPLALLLRLLSPYRVPREYEKSCQYRQQDSIAVDDTKQACQAKRCKHDRQDRREATEDRHNRAAHPERQ